MSAQKDHVNDVRASSYDAATARPAGYQGTIDDAIAQIRAEPDVARPYWPLNMSRERHALLGFLGVLRSKAYMSGVQTEVGMPGVYIFPMNEDEDDSIVYVAPDTAPEPGFYTLEYARKAWPQNFSQ
jgi:hypothetical protein